MPWCVLASWYSSKLFEVKNLTPFPVAIFWDILAKRRQFSEQVLSPMNGHILINISCSGVEEVKFCPKKMEKVRNKIVLHAPLLKHSAVCLNKIQQISLDLIPNSNKLSKTSKFSRFWYTHDHYKSLFI